MDAARKLNLTHMVRPAQQSEGQPTPGLLMLHGRGADEADLMGLEPALDTRLTVISVRAPLRLMPGFEWYIMHEVGTPDDRTIHASVAALREFITNLPSAYNIDPQRLYLLGFSQGAVMSAAMSLIMPEAIAGAILHSGYIPTNSGLDFDTQGAKGKPYFVAHGVYDDVIPVPYGEQARDYLQSLEANVTYREYPIGHGISEESLYDLSEWLAEQLRRDT